MKFYLLLILFLYNTLITAQNQKCSIRGQVKLDTGLPAELVNVTILGTTIGDITDKNGNYEIRNLQPGIHEVQFSLMGYAPVRLTVELSEGEKKFLPEIILNVLSSELEEIIVQDYFNKYENVESEYTARLPLRNIELPQSYSTSTQSLFQEQNIVDYGSAIKSIPGGVNSAISPVGVTNLFVRGFTTNAYIRNGLYVLSPSGGDLQTTERIEIIRGPSGSIYGASASYGGLMNKVTKKPLVEKSINASLSLGSFNLQRFTGDINFPLNEQKTILLRLNTTVHSEGSFQDFGFQRNYLLAPSIYYELNKKLDILFEAELNIMDHSLHTHFLGAGNLNVQRIDEIKTDYFTSYSSPNIDLDPDYLNNYFIRIGFKFSSDWNLKTYLAASDFRLNGGNIIPLFINDSLMIRRLYEYNGSYNTLNFMPIISGTYSFAGLNNKLAAGFDYKQASGIVSTSLNNSADTINYLSGKTPLLNIQSARDNFTVNSYTSEFLQLFALFFTNSLSITEKLNLILSLRYEFVDNSGADDFINNRKAKLAFTQGAFSPQAGITYQLLKDNLSLFLNYMNGTTTVAPNSIGQTFKPEFANQFEGGIKIELGDGTVSSTISYYDINVENKIRRNPDDPIRSIQDGTQISRGVDADIRLNPIHGLNMILGYAFNESKFIKANPEIEGKRPLGIPKHALNFWASYFFRGLLKGLGFGAGFIYSGSFYYDDRNTLSIPSYVLLNAGLYFKSPSFNIYFTGNNLSDKRYWDHLGTPQMPARYILSLQFHF